MKTLIGLIAALNIAAAAAQTNEVIDITGDGTHNVDGVGMKADRWGNIYATGSNTDNVIRMAASAYCSTAQGDCQTTEIIDATGDGTIAHDRTAAVAIDSKGHVYVVGQFSDNLWRVQNPVNCSTDGTPCVVQEIVSPSGDGVHNLDNPFSVAVDADDNVYVGGSNTHNVYRIAASETCSTTGAPCVITEILDSSGDGTNTVANPVGLAVDTLGNVYVTTQNSDNVFRINTPGTCTTTLGNCNVSEIMDDTGDGSSAFDFGRGIITDSANRVIVGSLGFGQPGKVFLIDASTTCSTTGMPCNITEIFNAASPQQVLNLAVDDADNIYFAGGNGENAWRIDKPAGCSTTGTPCTLTEIIDATGDGTDILDGTGHVAVANLTDVYVSGGNSDNVFRVKNAADSLDLIYRSGYE